MRFASLRKVAALVSDLDVDGFVKEKFAGLNDWWMAQDLDSFVMIKWMRSGKDSFMYKVLVDAGCRKKGRNVCSFLYHF